MMKKHTVALFAFDQCQLLDVTGPASVFGVANSIAGQPFYDVKVVSPQGGLVSSSCGVATATLAPKPALVKVIHTLLIAGGGAAAMCRSIEAAATRSWLKRCVQSATRFGSICSGVYILADLGVLHGMRVATHWANCDDLAKEFPNLSVDKNSLFVVSGKLWTSAGVSTGIDMALAMVEQDLGRSIADKVAKFLVLYARRPGYQSQFSEVLNAQIKAGSQFSELIAWLQAHSAEQINVSSLAVQCGLSERTFYRKFVAATGQTPAEFVQNTRLEIARTLLATDLPLKTIAAKSGMNTIARFNRAFERRFGLSPSMFRKVHHVERSA